MYSSLDLRQHIAVHSDIRVWYTIIQISKCNEPIHKKSLAYA